VLLAVFDSRAECALQQETFFSQTIISFEMGRLAKSDGQVSELKIQLASIGYAACDCRQRLKIKPRQFYLMRGNRQIFDACFGSKKVSSKLVGPPETLTKGRCLEVFWLVSAYAERSF